MTATLDATQTTAAPSVVPPAASAPSKGFSFHDLWETVNPLQHLPLIAPIYRELTGDTITPAARIAGDSLYGGMFGAIGGIVDSLVEGETGKDIGGHVMATLFGDNDDKAAAVTPAPAMTSVADASPPAASAGMPTSLLPPGGLSPVTGPSAPVVKAAATPSPTGPSQFYASLQKGGHSSHGKPLTTSVPLPDAKPAARVPSLGQPGASDTPTALGAQSPAQAAAPGAKPSFVNPLTDTTNSNDIGPMTSNEINPALASGSASGMPAMMMKALDQYAKLQKQQTATGVAQTDMLVN